MTPTIKVPTIRTPRSGLCFSRGTWRAMFTKDGKRLMKSMKTKDLVEAARRRDEFYATLGVEVTHGKGERFIYPVEHFVIKVQGAYIGTASTIEEARSMRDRAMEMLGIPTL